MVTHWAIVSNTQWKELHEFKKVIGIKFIGEEGKLYQDFNSIVWNSIKFMEKWLTGVKSEQKYGQMGGKRSVGELCG